MIIVKDDSRVLFRTVTIEAAMQRAQDYANTVCRPINVCNHYGVIMYVVQPYTQRSV